MSNNCWSRWSEADGWGHLYRYDGQRELLARLTSGPWPVDGTCCTMCGDDPSEPCDWSTAYYPQNKTLVQYSNSPAADPHCARFQEGTAMWSDKCVPFEIPGVMCANMKVVVTDENCECPKHASHLSADRWGQIATSLVV